MPTNSGSKSLSPSSRNIPTNASDSEFRLVKQPPTPRKSMLNTGPATPSNMSFSSSLEFDPYKEQTPVDGASTIAPGSPFNTSNFPQQGYGQSWQTYADVADQERMRAKDINMEAVGESSEKKYADLLVASNITPSTRPSSVVPSIVMVGTTSSQEPPAAGHNVPLSVDRPLPSRPASVAASQLLASSQPPVIDVNFDWPSPPSIATGLLASPHLPDSEIQIKIRPASTADVIDPFNGSTSFHQALSDPQTTSRPTSTVAGNQSQPLGTAPTPAIR
jgi:hypothetical protein